MLHPNRNVSRGLFRDSSDYFEGFLRHFVFSTKDNITFFEQHERLNTSLAALTRHVAHVQFRLHQVISAPTSEDREVNQDILFQLSVFIST